MDFDIKQIEKEARQTKKNLLERQNRKPPMCNRLTMSISSLLDYCEKVLFLCKTIKKQKKEINDLNEELDNLHEEM